MEYVCQEVLSNSTSYLFNTNELLDYILLSIKLNFDLHFGLNHSGSCISVFDIRSASNDNPKERIHKRLAKLGRYV